MPWKECSVMDERVCFIARLLEGESLSDLCREAGISRKTGHKLFNRYKEEGVTAITDRSRRLYRYANQLPPQLEAMIVGLKEVEDGIWLVSFLHYDLGYIDLEQKTLQPLDNPFGTRLLPMSREHSVTYVSGTDTRTDGAQGRNRTTDTAIFSRMLYQLSYLGGGVIGTKMGIAEPGAGIKRLAQCQAGCATEPRPSLNGRFGLAGELGQWVCRGSQ